MESKRRNFSRSIHLMKDSDNAEDKFIVLNYSSHAVDTPIK